MPTEYWETFLVSRKRISVIFKEKCKIYHNENIKLYFLAVLKVVKTTSVKDVCGVIGNFKVEDVH